MKNNLTAKILISISVIAISISAFIALSQTTKPGNISAIFSSTLHNNKKIRVLIVPGHEPNDGGADYKGIYERDLNLQLSIELENDLSKNPNIEVMMVRDENGWNSNLENFVTTSSSSIMSWVADMKNKMMAEANAGKFKIIIPGMQPNDATSEAVLYLYGTNKWAEENNIDLIFNVHFNNNPKINGKPNYSGYCIYVPDSQFGNASSSLIFANYLNNEISKIENKSNMPQEKTTIIPDQELAAMGSYGTLNIPTALVEYSYIYEQKMLSSSTRNAFIEKAASSTATAISDYVENEMIKK